MRHAIIVVGSEECRSWTLPTVVLRDNEPIRTSTWYASTSQQDYSRLLDDIESVIFRMLLVPFLAYRFYLLVQSTKLWSGKRPLVLVRGRGLASRVAAYAGTWGGGDVVKADLSPEKPLGPTRFLLDVDGRLKLRAG